MQFFGRMEIKDALSYLRMIAYKDDLSFLRVANVPRRNLGEAAMKFLRGVRGRGGAPLRRLRRSLEDDIQGDEGGAVCRAGGVLLRRLRPAAHLQKCSRRSQRGGYEKMLRTEGSQERLDNLAELKQSVYGYETSCGEEHPGALSGPCGPLH